MNDREFRLLLDAARRGDSRALGHLLADASDLLEAWADRQLGVRLRARLEPDDIVQQTMFEAQRDFAAYRGTSRQQWLCWLRAIVGNNIRGADEYYCATGKRALDHERSLDAVGEQRDAGPFLTADQSSPSQRAIKDEVFQQLATAIECLPPDQREAVRLRHLEGYSLKELATAMGRSETAVAGLLKRGLQKLREQMVTAGNSSI